MGLVFLFIADSGFFDYTKNKKKLVGKFFLIVKSPFQVLGYFYLY